MNAYTDAEEHSDTIAAMNFDWERIGADSGQQGDFNWERLGDIDMGRQTLGTDMPVVVYRLLQFTLKDVLAEKFGLEATENIFREAGYRAGRSFAGHVLNRSASFSDFCKNLQDELQNLRIGVLHIEKADIDNLSFVLTVSEDLDCSGLPVTGDTVCTYDEGFIAGLFEHHTGQRFVVRETDCWATGARTCRFLAEKG